MYDVVWVSADADQPLSLTSAAAPNHALLEDLDAALEQARVFLRSGLRVVSIADHSGRQVFDEKAIIARFEKSTTSR